MSFPYSGDVYYRIQNYGTTGYLQSNGDSVIAGDTATYWQVIGCGNREDYYNVIRNSQDECVFADDAGDIGNHPCSWDDQMWEFGYVNDVDDSDGMYFKHTSEAYLYVNASSYNLELRAEFTDETVPYAAWALSEPNTNYVPPEIEFCVDPGTSSSRTSSRSTSTRFSSTSTRTTALSSTFTAASDSNAPTSARTTAPPTIQPATATVTMTLTAGSNKLRLGEVGIIIALGTLMLGAILW